MECVSTLPITELLDHDSMVLKEADEISEESFNKIIELLGKMNDILCNEYGE